MTDSIRKFPDASGGHGPHEPFAQESNDRPRAGAGKRRAGRVLLALAALALLGVATWGLRAAQQRLASVDRSTLWIGAVRQGEFLRDVRANGTLVPREIRWVPAPGDGRVERIPVKPGEEVTADTVLIELSNPQLEKERLDAEWAVNAAEAQLKNVEAELQGQLLTQESALANVRSEHEVAELQRDRDVRLQETGLLAAFEVKVSIAKEKELATRAALAAKSLLRAQESMTARLASQQAQVEQARALLDLRKRQWADLQVKAGASGTVQQIAVEVGQQVAAAATLAKVAQQGELKAELRVQETQVSDVALGQPVQVDTRNGIVPGHVSRIDPSVQAGAVLVEVLFDGPLPKGARPDLSVDGTIELQRIANTLFVERPVSVTGNATLPMFRIGKDGIAARVPVQFGSGSSAHVQVLQGLSAGDEIILSTTTQWDQVQQVRVY